MERQSILISGARAPVSLEMVRSFGRLGCSVYLMDSMSYGVARWSRYVKKFFLVSSPKYDLNGYLTEVRDIVVDREIDHLIPVGEEAVYLSQIKDNLPCKVWTSDIDLVASLHNKFSFAKDFKDVFPTPKTVGLEEFEDWEQSEKYVFKPKYSRFATSIVINQKISKDHFDETVISDWIVQDYIEGDEICVYSIWDSGKLKAYTTYSPKYRIGKGAGIFFEHCPEDRIFSYVTSAGERLNYTGQLSFDVIMDGTGRPVFIECNPRATSGAHLIGEKLAQSFLDNSEFINEKLSSKSIKLALYLSHFKSFVLNRLVPSSDVVFDKQDIMPFFMQWIGIIEIYFVSIKHKISWLKATSDDIEWDESSMLDTELGSRENKKS